jgi:NADH-quinone oxidoreductase subunit C
MTDVSGVDASVTTEVASRLASMSVEVTEAFGDVTVTVTSPQNWVSVLRELRDELHFSFFDWLSAVDEGDDRFSLYCHLYNPDSHRRILVHTVLDGTVDGTRIESATAVYRGAAWHERETSEMFGVQFTGHPYPERLLLSDEGHPLRKDFVLTARASKSWPGAKEPGESGDGAPSRRKMQPPGVPDPSWGPHEAGSDHE